MKNQNLSFIFSSVFSVLLLMPACYAKTAPMSKNYQNTPSPEISVEKARQNVRLASAPPSPSGSEIKNWTPVIQISKKIRTRLDFFQFSSGKVEVIEETDRKGKGEKKYFLDVSIQGQGMRRYPIAPYQEPKTKVIMPFGSFESLTTKLQDGSEVEIGKSFSYSVLNGGPNDTLEIAWYDPGDYQVPDKLTGAWMRENVTIDLIRSDILSARMKNVAFRVDVGVKELYYWDTAEKTLKLANSKKTVYAWQGVDRSRFEIQVLIENQSINGLLERPLRDFRFFRIHCVEGGCSGGDFLRQAYKGGRYEFVAQKFDNSILFRANSPKPFVIEYSDQDVEEKTGLITRVAIKDSNGQILRFFDFTDLGIV